MVWFQAAQQFVASRTPLERDLNEGSSAQDIGLAIMQTVEAIVETPSLNAIRASPKSARYLGALAMDAWMNYDMPYVNQFLLKGFLVERMQVVEPEALLTQRSPELNSLVGDMQQILQQADITSSLLQLTRGSCQCTTFSPIFDEEFGDVATKAAAKQRKLQELQRVPPVLKPDSTLWSIKKKAAARLQANKLKKSIELYTKSLKLVQEELNRNTRNRSRVKSLDESAKIESNLSLLFLRMKEPELALLHADNTVASYPTWSKGHCRRALAFEALSRFEEAEAAICKALDWYESEALEGSAPKGRLGEYEGIQKRVEAILNDAQEQRGKELDEGLRAFVMDEDNVGALNSIFAKGVFDTVVAYSTPVDVARLEQTCRSFAAFPEQRRRLALSGSLSNLHSDEVEHLILIYCSQKLDDPSGALKTLVV